MPELLATEYSIAGECSVYVPHEIPQGPDSV